MIHKMTLSQFNIIAYIKHHTCDLEKLVALISMYMLKKMKISQKLRLSNVLYNTIMDFNNSLKGKKLLVLLHHMKNNCAKTKITRYIAVPYYLAPNFLTNISKTKN